MRPIKTLAIAVSVLLLAGCGFKFRPARAGDWNELEKVANLQFPSDIVERQGAVRRYRAALDEGSMNLEFRYRIVVRASEFERWRTLALTNFIERVSSSAPHDESLSNLRFWDMDKYPMDQVTNYEREILRGKNGRGDCNLYVIKREERYVVFIHLRSVVK